MAVDQSMRASDADRDRIVTALRENMAAGRLSTDEFDERLGNALTAKTLGELEGLMADLPGAELGQRADAEPDRAGGNPPSRRGRYQPARRTARGSVLTVGILVLVICLISAVHLSLSFLWVAAALAVLVVARRIRGSRDHSGRGSARPQRYHRDGDRNDRWR